ncbi:MAG: hypothetical protein WD872_19815 [Pirellulaceae bacterium]
MIQFGQQPSAQRYADAQALVDGQLPAGQFAAVEGGAVIADADSHRRLVELLRSQGRSAKNLLILQSGSEYPSTAVIF